MRFATHAALGCALAASAAAAVGWARTPAAVERPAPSIEVVDIRPLPSPEPALRDLLTHTAAVRVAIHGWRLLPYQPGASARDNRPAAEHWRLYLDGFSLGDNLGDEYVTYTPYLSPGTHLWPPSSKTQFSTHLVYARNFLAPPRQHRSFPARASNSVKESTMFKAVERRLSRLTASRLLAVVAAAVAAVALPASAGAGQPVTSYPTHHVFAVLTDVCPFPVTVEGDSPGTERDYFDQSGALTRIEVHATEQDTFSANGKSLTGEPYTFNIRILFDSSGAITQFLFAGVVERVVLPDGSLFLAAGLVDFAAHGFPEALIAPDKGTSGNVDGFCAALSP